MKNISLILFCCFTFSVVGQNIDIEGLSKAKLFSVSGGVSANTIYNTSNMDVAREPFTYLLNGNLNLKFLTFAVPLSYTLTNQGGNLGYSVPFRFNRLSISPKYKWITAHIGDANMSFSPYTLNGYPFTGVGVELNPKGPIKVSAMSGRLLKAVAADGNPNTAVAYKRMGYGTKITFEQEKYGIDFISFYAKDDIYSLSTPLDAQNVLPKENLVNSLNFSTSVIDNVTVNFEYAYSALTEDIRAQSIGHNIPKIIFNTRENTVYYGALKTSFETQLMTAKVGLGYEKIDPGYTTLGTLFMVNDFENITMNLAQPFYQNKIQLSTNVGYQRDNLNNVKKENSKRIVAAVSLNYQVTNQFNIGTNYSNFGTFTNKRLNQFDQINTIIENTADTLNYRQLAQNTTIITNYNFGKKDTKQVLSYNYNISSSANEQGGVIRKGQTNLTQNHNLNHTVDFEQSKINISTTANYTINQVGTIENTSSGAGINATKKIFSDKLSLSIGGLYNETAGQGKKMSIINGKMGMNYILLKQHNFSMSTIQTNQKTNDSAKNRNELTISFGYNYNF